MNYVDQQTDSLPESDSSKPDAQLSAELEAQVKHVKSLFDNITAFKVFYTRPITLNVLQ